MTERINGSLYKRRWVIWSILALGYIIVFFHRVAVGVVRQELMESFNITDIQFGNLGAMYFYAYMIMQIPSGLLADTQGARKTVTFGTLFAGIGSILFGFSTNIAMAYIGRLIVGLGVSVVFIAILKFLSQWFREDEFGRMSGLTSFIGNGGSLLAQYPLVLMVSFAGWQYSFILIGFITIGISALSYILVRNKPEDIGLPPISESRVKSGVPIGNSIKGVFSNPYTWPPLLIFGGMFGSFISLIGTWGVPYFIDTYGITKGQASIYTMVGTLGLMIGGLIAGTISDKIGRRKSPLMAFSTLYFITWLIFLFVRPGAMGAYSMYLLFFVMGLSCSGFVLTWAIGKEVNDPAYAGISTGTVNMGGFLFAAIIQPLIGYFLKETYTITSYNRAFLVCLVAAGISLVFILFIKETNCKNIYRG